MRTNIEIDDELMQQAIEISGLKTKKEVVNRALQEFVERYNRKNLFELKGKVNFLTDYDYKAMREGKENDTG